MMDREEWLRQILMTVDSIANPDYQSQAWFGRSDAVSSPDELYNTLFDDLTYNRFFDHYSCSFSESQKSAWRELSNKLESYAESTPNMMNPRSVFDDPRWEEIRRSATKFVEAFKGHLSEGMTGNNGRVSG